MLSIRAAGFDESRFNRMMAAPLRSMESEPVWAKIARLQQGSVPRVLDLFSGCGGLSLGLQRAGFAILAGLDSDPQASASHARNSTRTAPVTRRLTT
jgi:predicted RNA methylase